MNIYEVTIFGSNYEIRTQVIAETKEAAFEQALYTLINSTPKLDLFSIELEYEAELIEVMEEN